MLKSTLAKVCALGMLLLLAMALAHGSHYLPASGPGVVSYANPKALPNLSLLDRNGRNTAFPAKGVAWALYLGYTNCPDACPLTLERMRQAYRQLGSPNTLRLGFVTLDPARDTPGVMGKYLQNFAPVEGFTGSTNTINQLATALEVRYNLGPGGQRLFHTDAIALLNNQGQLVRMVYGASRLEVSALLNELRGLR